MNNLEETDRKGIIMKKKEARYLMGNKKKIQKGISLNDTKMYSFPQKSIDTWNGLKEEVIMAKNVQLKETLYKYKCIDRTTRDAYNTKVNTHLVGQVDINILGNSEQFFQSWQVTFLHRRHHG